jgi:dTDP-glucose 4,6-dehydratase
VDTLFVTGGAGFVGSALVRRLVRETDATVVCVDKLTYAGDVESLAEVASSPRYRFERADVADAPRVRAMFEAYRPTAVLHLAAESHVDRSIDGPADFVQTNVVGTFVLLQEALRYWRDGLGGGDAFRFVHVSTDEVYGSLGADGRFSETSAYAPNSPYAATKAAGDHLVRAWHRTYGLPAVTTNGSNSFGPYQFPEKLIPLVVARALAGTTIPVYGRGENVRDWLYVDDHADAVRAALARGRPGETYALGGGAERRNVDVIRAVCALLDDMAPDPVGPYARLITFVADRPGHDGRYAVDASKAARELGWTPSATFEAALRRTVAWYLQNRAWCERVAAGAYRLERLGLGAAAPAGDAA